jgi:hypothetical protein
MRWCGLEIAAYFREFGVDLARKVVQARDGNNCDKRSNQGVLNQILAGFIIEESAETLNHRKNSP